MSWDLKPGHNDGYVLSVLDYQRFQVIKNFVREVFKTEPNWDNCNEWETALVCYHCRTIPKDPFKPPTRSKSDHSSSCDWVKARLLLGDILPD